MSIRDGAESAAAVQHPGRRGRKRGRSLDAPTSPKTRKRKASTITDGEWLPGTWPAGHGAGAGNVGVGVMETEQLISEIERRPGIYDSSCPQYQDRVAKWSLWCEVCEIMTPRWHQLDEDRKASRVKELQKRWKSLRDSFMKELKLQREIQRTGQTANRKKYVFFDQMTFLMPCLEARGASRTGGLILREIDPYESETDSSKAERDGVDHGDPADCPSDDVPVNLSTANGSGLSGLSLGGLGALGGAVLAGVGGSLGACSGASAGSGASVGCAPQLAGGNGTGSQPDEDRSAAACALPPHAYQTDRKFRPDWKRKRSAACTAFDEDEEDPDGDRLFMLSLVPSLRSLRGAAKSALKIELAQLVHKTLYEPDDALADSMTESLAPVVSLAEGSPASSTQSECACGNSSSKCTCRQLRHHSLPLPLTLPLPLSLPLSLPRGLHSPKRSRHIGMDFSNFNGHASAKVHGI